MGVRIALSLAVLAAVVTACAPAATTSPTPTPAATATPSAVPAGPQLTGTVSVNGQFGLSSAFSVAAMVGSGTSQTPEPATSTCADYARGFATSGGTGFDVPAAESHGTPSVFVGAAIDSGYRGPGTYANPGTFEGAATVAVQTAQGSSFYVFHAKSGSTSTITVGPDGSGSLVFAAWQDDESRGGNQTGIISGTITWRCA